jgi:hypothetical protein
MHVSSSAPRLLVRKATSLAGVVRVSGTVSAVATETVVVIEVTGPPAAPGANTRDESREVLIGANCHHMRMLITNEGALDFFSKNLIDDKKKQQKFKQKIK